MSAPVGSKASRILRGAGRLLVGTVLVGGLLAVVMWDADFYTAREKWEHFKIAWWADWDAENWCPPGRVSENCTTIRDFKEALEAEQDFTFFRTVPVEGTGLEITTGVRFETAADVVDGAPISQWCYLVLPRSGAGLQIALANKSAQDPPVYQPLSSLDEGALAGSGLSADRLAGLAHSHCRFETQTE